MQEPTELLNIDARNPNAITIFNPYGGPPPMLVGGRFVLPQDQAQRLEQSDSEDKNSLALGR
jgi:hypothetical protein